MSDIDDHTYSATTPKVYLEDADGNSAINADEARRIYNEIVRRQKDPGLLEYAGKDLFQASIFPIPPRLNRMTRKGSRCQRHFHAIFSGSGSWRALRSAFSRASLY